MTQFYKKDDNGEFVDAQEDINQVIKLRVDRVNEKYSDHEALKEQISKLEAKQKEDEEKLNSALTDKANLEEELKAEKLNTEKVRIINEFKLSDDLAEFVTGSTAEEMRGRAEKLAHNVTPPTLDIKKDERPEPKKSDLAKLADSLLGTPEK